MEFGKIIPKVEKMQKYINSTNHPLSSADSSVFHQKLESIVISVTKIKTAL